MISSQIYLMKFIRISKILSKIYTEVEINNLTEQFYDC